MKRKAAPAYRAEDAIYPNSATVASTANVEWSARQYTKTLELHRRITELAATRHISEFRRIGYATLEPLTVEHWEKDESGDGWWMGASTA